MTGLLYNVKIESGNPVPFDQQTRRIVYMMATLVAN